MKLEELKSVMKSLYDLEYDDSDGTRHSFSFRDGNITIFRDKISYINIDVSTNDWTAFRQVIGDKAIDNENTEFEFHPDEDQISCYVGFKPGFDYTKLGLILAFAIKG